MILSTFSAGINVLRKRPGLAVLLYGLDLALAFVLSLSVLLLINDEMAQSGFAEEFARQFDFALWMDLNESIGDAAGAILAQLVWIVPLWLLWKAVAQVGLVHALRGDAIRPFWDGVGRYGTRAVLLALLYLLLLVVAAIGVGVVFGVLNAVWGGEVGFFWVNLVIVPTLFISVLAVLDLMHDYSRIALVVDEQTVTEAFGTGLRWPLRHGQASWLYLLWFAVAALLWLLPLGLDMMVEQVSSAGIWGLFLIQQLALLARSAATVGWIGSETALYETIRLREMPLYAEETEAVPLAYEPPPAPDADDPGLAVA